MKNVAIVLAAGQGKRMKSNVHKQYLLLEDKPILYYALKTFEESKIVTDIVLVVGKNEKEYCQKEIIEKYDFKKIVNIVEGGKERYHSVYNGIIASKYADYIFVHDGARPFVSETILERAYTAVKEFKACVVGVKTKDTIKIADSDGFVKETPKRADVWQVQTPQVFSYSLIKASYEKMIEQEETLLSQGVAITDDAMVVEQFLKMKIKLVEGSYENIKITTPEDMDVAKSYLHKE